MASDHALTGSHNASSRTVYVSLQDPITALCAFMTEFGYVLASRQGWALVPEKYTSYNYGPFMKQLIDEIFVQYKEDRAVLGQHMPSTRLLIQDGLAPEEAAALAHRIFTATLDVISGALPTLPFGAQEGFIYSLFGDFDLSISTHRVFLEDPPPQGAA